MNTRNLQRESVWLMVICSVLWSIAGIFIKLLPWNAFVIAGWRSLISAGVIGAYMAVSKTRFVVNRSALVTGALLATTYLLFVSSNKLTTSANAIVLQFTAPIFVMLFSAVFYRQRFCRRDILAVGVTFVGISLCFFDQIGAGRLSGNLLSILSGVCLGAMFVTTGNTDNHSRLSGILLGQLFTACIGIPAMLFTENSFTPGSVISIAVLGVFQLGIPYILYSKAVRHATPLMCCLISALEPLLNPVWVFLFDGEAPGIFSLVGGVVVIATVTAWNLVGARMASQAALTGSEPE